MAGFFSFHQLVSTTIVKAVYVFGLVLISFLALAEIVMGTWSIIDGQMGSSPHIGLSSPLLIATGIVILTLGNLIWRLTCEAWILMFSMHELLALIARSVTVRGETDGPPLGYQRTIT